MSNIIQPAAGLAGVPGKVTITIEYDPVTFSYETRSEPAMIEDPVAALVVLTHFSHTLLVGWHNAAHGIVGANKTPSTPPTGEEIPNHGEKENEKEDDD